MAARKSSTRNLPLLAECPLDVARGRAREILKASGIPEEVSVKFHFRRRLPKSDLGIAYTEKKAGGYHITVKRGLCEESTIDTLLHEVAHVLDWEKNGDTDKHHSAKFGAIWARLYRAYFDES